MSYSNTSYPPPSSRLEPDQFQAMWKTCETDDPSQLEGYLSTLAPCIDTAHGLSYCLKVAIRHGPHFTMIEHLVSRHNVQVDGYILESAISTTTPFPDKAKLLDYLFDQADWDVNAPVSAGRTLLSSGIKDKETAEYLLRRGANPNLGRACTVAIGYWGADRLLPESGAVLASTIRWGSLEVVELLVQYGGVLDYADATHCAVERDDMDMLDKVIELGADVERMDSWAHFARDQIGTALHRAIREGKADMVGVLLDHGADVWSQGRSGKSAIELVDEEGVHQEIRDMVCSAQVP